MRVSIETIKNISDEILTKVGVPEDDRKIIVDSILYAHLADKSTHGIGRLPIYVRKIKKGLMSAETKLSVIRDTPVVSHYDAQNGFGQVAAFKGMEFAIEKAKVSGTGVVGIKGSNNFGTAGFFVELAAKNNMIGFIFSNASPAIAPTGGYKPIFGTNPISIGFPGGNNMPAVILDMATSNAARGKIRLAVVTGEKIPKDWALDKNGKPTTDPLEALKGSMIPIGGYKGFGLSLVVDVLAGLLTCSSFGGDVKSLNHSDSFSGNGHLIIVINIRFFQDVSTFINKMEYLTNNVKACGEEQMIFLPGEKKYNFQKKSKGIINVSDKQVEDINLLANNLGLNFKITSTF